VASQGGGFRKLNTTHPIDKQQEQPRGFGASWRRHFRHYDPADQGTGKRGPWNIGALWLAAENAVREVNRVLEAVTRWREDAARLRGPVVHLRRWAGVAMVRRRGRITGLLWRVVYAANRPPGHPDVVALAKALRRKTKAGVLSLWWQKFRKGAVP
jgi:hypothetical protein